MPYDIKKKGDKWAIFHKGGGQAVKKLYDSKSEAERVAWLRMWHEGKRK